MANGSDTTLSNQIKNSHALKLQGSLALSVYISIDKEPTLLDFFEQAIKSIDMEFKYRYEIMQEEATSNEAIVNPFQMNSLNMKRILPFHIYLPRKQLATFPHSKIKFNEFSLSYEDNEQVAIRLFENLGMKAEQFTEVEAAMMA